MAAAERRELVLAAAERLGASACRLGRFESFAWFTDGGDNRVDHAAVAGVAEVVVGPDGVWVLADNIEAERLVEEQVPGFEVVSFPWHAGPGAALRSLVGDGAVVSDVASADFAEALVPVRCVLDEGAQERYRAVGRDAQAAMAAAASSVTPDMTEFEAAGLLVGECRRRGLYAPVALAAGAERVGRWRHPIPGPGRVGESLMLVVCAERGGLYANLTRFVGPTPAGVDACSVVLAGLRDATRPGRTLGEVFADGVALYESVGYPGEWQHHHQGGITGYRSREVVATPGSDVEVKVGMAFAWNPSVPGAKAEETFLLTDTGPDVLT